MEKISNTRNFSTTLHFPLRKYQINFISLFKILKNSKKFLNVNCKRLIQLMENKFPK
jgi:hypothetical protein